MGRGCQLTRPTKDEKSGQERHEKTAVRHVVMAPAVGGTSVLLSWWWWWRRTIKPVEGEVSQEASTSPFYLLFHFLYQPMHRRIRSVFALFLFKTSFCAIAHSLFPLRDAVPETPGLRSHSPNKHDARRTWW